MKRLHLTVCILGMMACRTGFGQTTVQASLPEVAQSLKEYYADEKNVPPWEEAMRQLASPQPEVREKAGAYLQALLEQSLKDEKSGLAPWRATPYWGSNGENPAQNLRESIIEAVGKATLPDEAVPVLAWYLDGQRNARWASGAAKALAKINGPRAGKLLLELASRPHPNSEVTLAALKQVLPRQMPIKREQLLALCVHYRPGIREAAVMTAKAMGIGPIPGYRDAEAMKSESIRKLMAELGELMIELPPVDARFAVVTTTYFEGDKKTGETNTRGWVLEEKDGTVTLFTPFGMRNTLEISEKPKPARYGGSVTITCAKEPIEQEVERVAALRQKGDPDFELSERGGLTGQFQGRGASLEEAMLAEWLFVGHQDELAAKVLLPAIDTLYEDEHLVEMVKDRLGIVYAYHMLASFAGDRDYVQTLKWAEVVQKKFAGSRFDRMAAELARQLPLRGDDFKKLKLPTVAEWADFQRGLDRAHQIGYLCERLRLLNCFQMGQPGGVDISQKQYAEACGISDDAAWGLNQGKTEVINPITELKQEKLTVDDILLLTPYLKEDWFIPSVEFWRDFNPQRDLLRTRAELAGMINHLAADDICNDAKMLKMNAAELGAYIETINRFARDNKGKSEADLLLQTLERVAAGKERWVEVRWRVSRLVELGDKRAAPVLAQILKREGLDGYEVEEILMDARKIDPTAVRAVAPGYLNHKRLGVRAEAAIALLGTDQAALARKTLGEVLAVADRSNFSSFAEVVEALLADKSEESRREALRVFEGLGLAGADDFSRRRVVKDFTEAGMPDAYRYYLRLLDLPGKTVGGVTYGGPAAEAFAGELVSAYHDSDPEMKKIMEETKGNPAEARVRVRAWLQAKIKELEAGKR